MFILMSSLVRYRTRRLISAYQVVLGRMSRELYPSESGGNRQWRNHDRELERS